MENREFNETEKESPITNETYAEFSDPLKERNEKIKKASEATLSVFVVAGFIAAALPARPTLNAEFTALNVSATSVSYNLSIADYERNTDYRVVVYNDFTRKEAPIDTPESSGEITDLKPGMRYTIAVRKERSLFAKKKFQTAKKEEPVR